MPSEHLVNRFLMYSSASSFIDLYISIAVSFRIRLEIVGQPRLWISGAVDASDAIFMIILDSCRSIVHVLQDHQAYLTYNEALEIQVVWR